MKYLILLVFISSPCFSLSKIRTCSQLKNFISKTEKDSKRDKYFDQRIQELNSADTFSFFRAWPSLFHYFLDKHFELFDLKGLDTVEGMTIGDAHNENFSVMAKKKSVMPSFDDFDDNFVSGSLLSDVFRLLVSTSFQKNSGDTQNNLAMYVNNLHLPIDEVRWSPETKKLFSKAIKDQNKQDKSIDKDSNGRPYFKTKKGPECQNISRAQVHKEIKSFQGLSHLFSKDHKLLDFYCRRKIKGGSGGLKRFYLLLANQQRKLKVIEIKKLGTKPSALYDKDISPFMILASLKEVNEKNFNQLKGLQEHFDFVVQDHRVYLIREKSRGFKKLDPMDYSSFQARNIIYDQFKIMALFHRKSLSEEKRDFYIKKFKKLSFTFINKSVEKIKKQITLVHESCKKSSNSISF